MEIRHGNREKKKEKEEKEEKIVNARSEAGKQPAPPKKEGVTETIPTTSTAVIFSHRTHCLKTTE